MRAELWRIFITESTLAAVHNHFVPITELFIPSENLVVNYHNGDFRVFENIHDRYNPREGFNFHKTPPPEKIDDVDLSDDHLALFKSFLDAHSRCQTAVKHYLPDNYDA